MTPATPPVLYISADTSDLTTRYKATPQMHVGAEAWIPRNAERDRLRADAQAAVALVLERAADAFAAHPAIEAKRYADTLCQWRWRVYETIRAFADADALGAVEALRGEARESAMQALASMGQAQEAYEAQLKAEAELAAAQQREAGLVEALTPSGDTKAAYMGEIKDPDTKRMVSWTAIKMVMAMVSARAALSNNGRTGDLPDAVDPPCTDCDDTGITHQTERFCSCGAGIAAAHNGRGE